MQLGDFKFAIGDVAPQTIGRSTEYRWAWVDLMNALAAGQFTGVGQDTLALEGVVYPEFVSSFFNGSFNADPLQRLRDLAATGEPQALVSGGGTGGVNLGRWVITNIGETKGPFFAGGIARKVTFTLSLRKFDDG